MKTMNDYCREQFGEKLYKLSLDGGMTCPNRDGTLDTRGCIFCSEGGSGDFAAPSSMPLQERLEAAKERVSKKYHGSRYIAYFQAYTNTYAPVEQLRSLFFPLLEREDIAVISLATRPDCLGPDVLALLAEMAKRKPLWVELGLQTIHENSAAYIRRGYPTELYDRAVRDLNSLGIHVITHVILGLPGECREDMLETVRHVADIGSGGIKLQLLHILKGTDLAAEYEAGRVRPLEREEYLDLVTECVRIMPADMVVHRLTGDGPRKLLLAPLWSRDKKALLNDLNRRLMPKEKLRR